MATYWSKNYMKHDVSALEHKLNYIFRDKDMLIRALTHRSVRAEHNERLEFLGDSILNFIIAHALYQKLPQAKEGDLSRYRALLVCEDSLADLALQFELSNFLILGAGELRAGGFRRKSILADCLEAIIAAVYLDSDLVTCQQLIEAWFAKRLVDVAQTKVKKDPKSTLQEYLQARKFGLPSYKILKVTGADHDQTFVVECAVQDMPTVTKGSGQSRRIAEQEAAAAFLKIVLNEGA